MAGNIASQFKVERFDGKGSFTLWQGRVKDILVQQGLSRALKGKDGKPEKMSNDDWEDVESRCVSTIRLCIGDNIINNVNGVDSAPELWEKLEKLYLAKSLTTKLNLKRDLYKLKMKEGENLLDHMNVFHGIIDQLTKVDVKIEEEDKALLLLTSLPDSYDNIVTTILYGKETVKMEEVESTLLSNNKRRSNDDDPLDSIMLTHGQERGRTATRGSSGSSRSKSRGEGTGIQCHGCREFGHIRRNCPNRKEVNGSNDARLSLVTNEDFGDVITIYEGKNLAKNDWILDSGSKNHICSLKERFVSLQSFNRGFLKLPNGNKSVVEGVGTVKFKMFDGVERTLDGVVYAPKLRFNVISLSRLDSAGYTYSAAGGVLKVKKGCMVTMRGEVRDGLYRLVESTNSTRTSMENRKWNSLENKILRRVSFAGATTRVRSFLGTDKGDEKFLLENGLNRGPPSQATD